MLLNFLSHLQGGWWRWWPSFIPWARPSSVGCQFSLEKYEHRFFSFQMLGYASPGLPLWFSLHSGVETRNGKGTENKGLPMSAWARMLKSRFDSQRRFLADHSLGSRGVLGAAGTALGLFLTLWSIASRPQLGDTHGWGRSGYLCHGNQ